MFSLKAVYKPKINYTKYFIIIITLKYILLKTVLSFGTLLFLP